MKRPRRLEECLSNKPALLGLIQTQPNLAISEMVGVCGYDFLILDAEHGVFGESEFLQAFQVLQSSEVTALVRLPGHEAPAVGRYLDMGADGIVVPNVCTAEQAKTLVRAMHYPPAGTRGFGASVHRGTRYGLDVTSHLADPRGSAWLLLMIESRLGVANVEEVLSVEGVDGLFVGPFDLTADLGAAGDFGSPAYGQALGRVEKAAAKLGKIIGTGPHPGYPTESLLARGHRLLLLGADMPLIREAMTARLSAARSCLEASKLSAAK